MHLTSNFHRPTFPADYHIVKYHAPGVKQVSTLSLIHRPSWCHPDKIYDYDSITVFLKILLGSTERCWLDSKLCAMHRIANIHGAALNESHEDLNRHPQSYISDTPRRRRTAAELTQLAFDSLAALERLTGSMTLCVVMHGELKPNRPWSRADLIPKLTVWTGDSVYNDQKQKKAWGELLESVVDKIGVPWQHGYELRMKTNIPTSTVNENPVEPPPLTPRHLHNWEPFRNALPQTPRPGPLARSNATSPPSTPTRQGRSHQSQSGHTPAPSSRTQTYAGGPSPHTPNTSSRSRPIALNLSSTPLSPLPPRSPNRRFDFTPAFCQTLLRVGWDCDLPANYYALNALHDSLIQDMRRDWLAAIVVHLQLPGEYVMDVYNAASDSRRIDAYLSMWASSSPASLTTHGTKTYVSRTLALGSAEGASSCQFRTIFPVQLPAPACHTESSPLPFLPQTFSQFNYPDRQISVSSEIEHEVQLDANIQRRGAAFEIAGGLRFSFHTRGQNQLVLPTPPTPSTVLAPVETSLEAPYTVALLPHGRRTPGYLPRMSLKCPIPHQAAGNCDYTMTLYDRHLPHIGLIPNPRYPFEIGLDPAILFRPLTSKSFQFSAITSDIPQSFSLGRPHPSFLDDLKRVVQYSDRQLEDRLEKWRQTPTFAGLTQNATKLTTLMHHTLNRLEILFLSLVEAQRMVAACQRCWLEIYALKLYMEHFGTDSRAVSGSSSLPVSILQTIGTFVDNERDLELLYSARIPVWYIRPMSQLVGSPSVHTLRIQPLPAPAYAGEYTTAAPRKVVRSDGILDLRGVREAIYADSWNSSVPPNRLHSSSKNPRDSKNQISTRKRKRQPISTTTAQATPSKFSDTPLPPSSASIPYSNIPRYLLPWDQALAHTKTDTTPQDLSAQTKWLHAVPHALWFSSVNVDKQHRYFINWIAIRARWLEALADGMVSPQTSRFWKDFLSHSPDRGPLNPALNHRRRDGPTDRPHTSASPVIINAKQVRTAERLASRHEAQRLFCSLLPDVPTRDEARALTWFGNPLFSADTQSNSLIRHEILAELNIIGFHHELKQLDRHLTSRVPQAERTQAFEALRNCMSAGPVFAFTSRPCSETLDLSQRDTHKVIPILEALRQIVGVWPSVPEDLTTPVTHDSDPREVAATHAALATFYVQTFMSCFSTYPILPSSHGLE
ncbi:hypothetical protein SISNIDRAFT_491988 [Sistotremastrum niveocremeum HHB9708]|uniref:Uncharacterized protein n=1 Tax=Sistotremastrum niveocremeum HHB9708 TaxID=1314777 RepID=A0A164M660_9AGAM|nr:hypothetical protein SISNIDRAFT_491988 [Sistotremastrum niveocremeum HHB9708]